MDAHELTAEVRTAGGKGPARQLRSKGLIPAVFYGPGTDGLLLAIAPKALKKALSTEYKHNQLIKLSIGGKTELALVREVQVDVLRREPRHCDFYRVELNTTGKAAGVVEGAELRIVYRELPVTCSPDSIPAKIVTDVTHLGKNQVIQTKDLKLPAGVTVLLPPDRTIVAVVMEERKDDEPVAGAAAAAAAGAPAAGAAAAPAAGGKAPAAAAAPAAKDAKKK